MMLEKHHHSLVTSLDFHDLDITSEMLNTPVSTAIKIHAQNNGTASSGANATANHSANANATANHTANANASHAANATASPPTA